MKQSLIYQNIYEFADNLRNIQFNTSPLSNQINCVIRVLQESIEFVKISLILPQILENARAVKRVLAGTEFEAAASLIDDYILRRYIIIKEKRQPLSDHGMIKIIDYFMRHHSMHKLFPEFIKNLTEDDHQILNIFERLLKICEENLQRNARKEISNERHLNKVYQENETVKSNIIKVKGDITHRLVKERWVMAAKLVFIQKCEEKLTHKKQMNEQRMLDESDKCQRIIQAHRKHIADEQHALEIELKDVRLEFDNQVEYNQREEKSFRDEKSKLELKLQFIIKKYDEMIKQRMLRSMEIRRQQDETNEKMEILMKTFHKNKVIYNEIVLKREREAELQENRRILSYMMNRAASKIQRYWRKWRKRLLMRRSQQMKFMKQRRSAVSNNF